MKACARILLTHALALLLCVSVAFAQTTELGPSDQSAPDRPLFTQQELDQMLAPIALYPDALLSQILMASTYPIEVVQAARWSRANPNLTGDQAVQAVEQNNWDPSVKSLVAFPQVLSMMDEKLDWMERLGDAFLSQQQQVMDSVQVLRQKAQAAGNLQSNDNVRVEPQGQTIIIEQANPQVVYVPYYNPTVVYGPWWYADYPPVYWGPWPGYYARPGYGAGFYWGTGITISTGFFFGAFDWPHRHVTVVNVNNYYYRPPPRAVNGPRGGWQHDPGHRRGVPYRDPVLRQEFGRHDGRPDTRREFRGNEPQRVQGPNTNNPGNRPDGRNRPDNRPDGHNTDNRPDGRNVPDNRPQERDRAQSRPDGNARPNTPDAGRAEPRNVPARPSAGNTPNRPNAPDAGRSEPRIVPAQPNAGNTPNRPNAPDAGRSEPRVVPPQPNASPAPNRPNAPDRARTEPRGVPTRPAAATNRPNVEPRPSIFDGVGRGPVVRDSSQRGHDSSQRMAPPAAMARPQGGTPAPRQSGNDQRPSAGDRRGNEGQQRQQQR